MTPKQLRRAVTELRGAVTQSQVVYLRRAMRVGEPLTEPRFHDLDRLLMALQTFLGCTRPRQRGRKQSQSAEVARRVAEHLRASAARRGEKVSKESAILAALKACNLDEWVYYERVSRSMKSGSGSASAPAGVLELAEKFLRDRSVGKNKVNNSS